MAEYIDLNLLRQEVYPRTIDEIQQKMNSTVFCVGSEHLVQITHINSPHSFYARLSCLRPSVKLLETRGQPMDADDVSEGAIVIYKSRAINCYIRGRVQKKTIIGNATFYMVFAIDYGFIDERISVKFMYHTEGPGTQCMPLALHCQLEQCEPLLDKFDADVLHAMKFYVGKYNTKIVILYSTAEKFNVFLRSVECEDDIASKLASLNFTRTIEMPHVEQVPVSRFQYSHMPVKIGDQFHVRVQSGTSIFNMYIAEVSYYDMYDDVIRWAAFTKYCMAQPSLDVELAAKNGQACGVKVLNPTRYERAIVTRVTVPNKKAMVKLVDWGREMEVPFGNIKPVTCPEILSQPSLANYVTADKMRGQSIALARKMLYPGLELVIEILEVGNGFRVPHRITIYPIATMPRPAFMAADDDDDDDESD